MMSTALGGRGEHKSRQSTQPYMQLRIGSESTKEKSAGVAGLEPPNGGAKT
jgi:hypothetical protein